MRSLAETVSLAVILGIIMCIGVFGNLLVVLAVLRLRRLRRALSNYLILNLAVADFLTTALPMPYQLATTIKVELISDNGWLCKVGGILSYPFYISSTLTLVMLAVDRYIALCNPLRYKSLVTPRVIFLMVVYTWCHAVLFTLLLGFLANMEFDPHGFDCGVSWHGTPLWLNISALIINVVLPFFILFCTSLRVLYIAKMQQNRIRAESRACALPQNQGTRGT